jgi:hypothetical protein
MEPIDFPQANVTYALDQPEYLPLPAKREENGMVTSCWQLTWRERFKILFSGRLYIWQLTFNQPLQPIRPDVALYLDPYKNGILKPPSAKPI